MAAAQKPIRVLAVDDHALLRNGIRRLIGAESDMQLVAEASTGREAVEEFRTHQQDITLMDLQMPDMNRIRSDHRDSWRISGGSNYRAFDVFRRRSGGPRPKSGARAYLLKGSVNKELLATIRAVHAGQKRIPAEVASGSPTFPAKTG